MSAQSSALSDAGSELDPLFHSPHSATVPPPVAQLALTSTANATSTPLTSASSSNSSRSSTSASSPASLSGPNSVSDYIPPLLEFPLPPRRLRPGELVSLLEHNDVTSHEKNPSKRTNESSSPDSDHHADQTFQPISLYGVAIGGSHLGASPQFNTGRAEVKTNAYTSALQLRKMSLKNRAGSPSSIYSTSTLQPLLKPLDTLNLARARNPSKILGPSSASPSGTLSAPGNSTSRLPSPAQETAQTIQISSRRLWPVTTTSLQPCLPSRPQRTDSLVSFTAPDFLPPSPPQSQAESLCPGSLDGDLDPIQEAHRALGSAVVATLQHNSSLATTNETGLLPHRPNSTCLHSRSESQASSALAFPVSINNTPRQTQTYCFDVLDPTTFAIENNASTDTGSEVQGAANLPSGHGKPPQPNNQGPDILKENPTEDPQRNPLAQMHDQPSPAIACSQDSSKVNLVETLDEETKKGSFGHGKLIRQPTPTSCIKFASQPPRRVTPDSPLDSEPNHTFTKTACVTSASTPTPHSISSIVHLKKKSGWKSRWLIPLHAPTNVAPTTGNKPKPAISLPIQETLVVTGSGTATNPLLQSRPHHSITANPPSPGDQLNVLQTSQVEAGSSLRYRSRSLSAIQTQPNPSVQPPLPLPNLVSSTGSPYFSPSNFVELSCDPKNDTVSNAPSRPAAPDRSPLAQLVHYNSRYSQSEPQAHRRLRSQPANNQLGSRALDDGRSQSMFVVNEPTLHTHHRRSASNQPLSSGGIGYRPSVEILSISNKDSSPAGSSQKPIDSQAKPDEVSLATSQTTKQQPTESEKSFAKKTKPVIKQIRFRNTLDLIPDLIEIRSPSSDTSTPVSRISTPISIKRPSTAVSSDISKRKTAIRGLGIFSRRQRSSSSPSVANTRLDENEVESGRHGTSEKRVKSRMILNNQDSALSLQQTKSSHLQIAGGRSPQLASDSTRPSLISDMSLNPGTDGGLADDDHEKHVAPSRRKLAPKVNLTFVDLDHHIGSRFSVNTLFKEVQKTLPFVAPPELDEISSDSINPIVEGADPIAKPRSSDASEKPPANSEGDHHTKGVLEKPGALIASPIQRPYPDDRSLAPTNSVFEIVKLDGSEVTFQMVLPTCPAPLRSNSPPHHLPKLRAHPECQVIDFSEDHPELPKPNYLQHQRQSSWQKGDESRLVQMFKQLKALDPSLEKSVQLRMNRPESSQAILDPGTDAKTNPKQKSQRIESWLTTVPSLMSFQDSNKPDEIESFNDLAIEEASSAVYGVDPDLTDSNFLRVKDDDGRGSGFPESPIDRYDFKIVRNPSASSSIYSKTKKSHSGQGQAIVDNNGVGSQGTNQTENSNHIMGFQRIPSRSQRGKLVKIDSIRSNQSHNLASDTDSFPMAKEELLT